MVHSFSKSVRGIFWQIRDRRCFYACMTCMTMTISMTIYLSLTTILLCTPPLDSRSISPFTPPLNHRLCGAIVSQLLIPNVVSTCTANHYYAQQKETEKGEAVLCGENLLLPPLQWIYVSSTSTYLRTTIPCSCLGNF